MSVAVEKGDKKEERDGKIALGDDSRISSPQGRYVRVNKNRDLMTLVLIPVRRSLKADWDLELTKMCTFSNRFLLSYSP